MNDGPLLDVHSQILVVQLSSSNPEAESQWHLFNDFLVRQMTPEEAVRFDPTWKLPSVLAYQIKTIGNKVDDGWKDNLDTTILYRRWAPQ